MITITPATLHTVLIVTVLHCIVVQYIFLGAQLLLAPNVFRGKWHALLWLIPGWVLLEVLGTCFYRFWKL